MKTTKLLIAAVGALLVTGCSTMQTKNPEETVTERAQERLDLVVAEELLGAYEYLSPGYRSSVTSTQYVRGIVSRPMRWTEAEVTRSECSESACKLTIKVKYIIFGAVPGASSFESIANVNENWVELDGTWFYVPEN